jgi:hypothetical protein
MIRELGKDTIEISCDECLQMIDYAGTFQQAIKHIRDLGWRSRYVDGDWVHVCAECVDEG